MNEITDGARRDIAEFGKKELRRLTFGERCGLLFAIHLGYPQIVVARAFNIAPTNVNAIGACLTHTRNPRYRDVAREWHDLGAEMIGEKYFTEKMRRDCHVAMSHHRAGKAEQTRMKSRANKPADLEGWHIVEGPNGPELHQIAPHPYAQGEWIALHVIGIDANLTPIFAKRVESLMPEDNYHSSRKALLAVYQKNNQAVPFAFPAALTGQQAEDWAKNKFENQS
jgi:hypothetical protein